MKRLVGVLLLAAVICYAGCYIVLSSIPVTPVYNEIIVKNGQYIMAEERAWSFINRHLLDENGAVRSNLKKAEGSNDTLAESVGLLMHYYLLRDRKDLFDRELRFLKRKLLEDGRYVKWKTGANVSCNAVIDDFRIIRALLDAYEMWGGSEYFNTAGRIQEGIYSNQLLDGSLCELFDWRTGGRRNIIPLCYFDFYTMHRLETYGKNWFKVWNRGLATVKNGRINQTSPLYYKYFNYDNKLYSPDEEFNKTKGVCLTYSLYTAIHLSEVNEDTSHFMEWLRKEIDGGKLYAWYNPITMKPSGNTESTAVYALAAVYCRKAGENKLYEELVDRMLKFMVSDSSSPYYGGFGNVQTGEFYSFDNLTALWALALSDS